MDLHLYVPALITFGASVVGFILGVFGFLGGFTDAEPSVFQELSVGFGILMVYAAPVAGLIAVGMQIAHWV